jgi:hypothetical protein
LSPEITIWTFTGKEIAKLNPTLNTPFRFAVSTKEDNLALIDNDWSIRVVDTNKWELKAVWHGRFRDVVIVDQGVIALDLEGRLHAACFSGRGVKPIGIADTGVFASILAVTEDGRLVIMGNGAISVHSVEYKLTSSHKD